MRLGEQTAETGERIRQGILWSLLILVLVGVSAVGIWSLFRPRLIARVILPGVSPRPPVYGSVPDFSLRERSGRQVRLSDLRDTVWIANVIFTSCPDECPLMTAKMAKLQADLAHVKQVRLVSITVDPEHDTLPILLRYAARFGADPERWFFLTGEKDSIYRLVRDGFRLAVVDPHEEGKTPSLALASREGEEDPTHSTRFVLVDRRARIRGYYDSEDEEALHRLRQHVQALLPEE